LPEALVRTLRHELGDFLQKVYATVAILKARLPPDWEKEHGLIARLRARAEETKEVLDATHDFVCTVILDCEPVDLAELARRLAAALGPRYPHLEIQCEAVDPAVVAADPRRAAQIAEALLVNACEAAHARVTCRVALEPGEVEWTVLDDGPGLPADQTDQLFCPFFTTKAGHAGLGLALAKKLMDLHGGRIHVADEPGGGCKASAIFPFKPPLVPRTL